MDLKDILNPIFDEIEEIEGVAMLGSNGENYYIYGKEPFQLQINFLKTLAILLQGIAEKLQENPQFFLGEMDEQNIAVIFLENLVFVMLLRGSENLGYLRLQMEELKSKLGNKLPELNESIEENFSKETFSIPSEKEITDILKKFTYIEG